ncbi:hypothetical protein GCM10023238_05490 [Streptomyces heliomycini]
MDRVALRGLKARGHHGVFPKEREEGQTFIVDLVLGLDTRPAAADDDLTKTVHYGIVAEEVVAVVQGEPVDLIETLAEHIAQVCLSTTWCGRSRCASTSRTRRSPCPSTT